MSQGYPGEGRNSIAERCFLLDVCSLSSATLSSVTGQRAQVLQGMSGNPKEQARSLSRRKSSQELSIPRGRLDLAGFFTSLVAGILLGHCIRGLPNSCPWLIQSLGKCLLWAGAITVSPSLKTLFCPTHDLQTGCSKGPRAL